MSDVELLQQLVSAWGPSGQEDEIRSVCQELFKKVADEVWIDPAGNLIGKLSGESSAVPPVRIMVHMDELSMIVKRVNEDGSLRVNPLGGIFPSAFGQGAVDVLGDSETFSGILSFGSMHVTRETASTHKMIPEENRGLGKSPSWEDVFVVTRKSPQELKKAGIHPGTRVVVSKSRRHLTLFQDCVAGYFLDNRAAIAIALTAFTSLGKKRPKGDVYVVATCAEEIGAFGASYAARTLPGEITLAIDVGPTVKEYQTVLSAAPIVVYQDAVATYDKKLADHLVRLGEKLGLEPQCAIWSSYGSDASLALSRGQSARAALLCFPVENTHGYEIMHKDSISKCAHLLEAYLLDI